VLELISAFLHCAIRWCCAACEYRLEKVHLTATWLAVLMTIHPRTQRALAVIRGSDTVDEARQ